jgi:hypothetical protein
MEKIELSGFKKTEITEKEKEKIVAHDGDTLGYNFLSNVLDSISDACIEKGIDKNDSYIQAEIKRIILLNKIDFVSKIEEKTEEQARFFWSFIKIYPNIVKLYEDSKVQGAFENKENGFEDAFKSMLLSGEIRDEVWLDVLKGYDQYINDISERFFEYSEELKKVFIFNFVNKINPELSYDLSEEQIKEKISSVSFQVVDPLSVNSDGSYRPITETVKIPLHIILNNNEETQNIAGLVEHELMHAVSTGETCKYFKDDDFRYVTQKSGIEINGINNKRFIWLNEIVTERLTNIALNREKSLAYKNLQDLFDNLMNGGRKQINENVLFDAYFENFSKGEEEYERDKNKETFWKKFVSEIEESYNVTSGANFLVKLDDILMKEGIEAAEKFIEKNQEKL